MGNFLKSTKCKIILGIVALLVGIMVYAVMVGGYTIRGADLFRNLISPAQKASNAISERVENVLNVYRGAEFNYNQNKELRQEVAELHKELAEYEDLKEELEELKAFVGIKETHEDFTLSVPCEVTGYVTNDPFGAFFISGGTENGISLYDPVVTEMGLVGVVTEVGEKTSIVTTILSPEVSVAVYCSTTKDQGVLTGSIALAMEGRAKLQYLDKDTSLKEDKILLTSGENGLFPKGYVVGYVHEVYPEETGLTAYASVDPASDLSDLGMVIVLTDWNGKDAMP